MESLNGKAIQLDDYNDYDSECGIWEKYGDDDNNDDDYNRTQDVEY